MAKPATITFFGHTSNGNLRGVCRVCRNKASKDWRDNNPDRIKSHSTKRTIGEETTGPGYTKQDVQKIRKRLGDCCAYCGCVLDGEGVVDHLIPIKHWGAHSAKNITLACKSCNGDKHSKTPDEFIAWRKKRGLSIRADMNWKKYQLPVTDDGVLDLIVEILIVQQSTSSVLREKMSVKLDILKPRLMDLIDNTLTSKEKTYYRCAMVSTSDVLRRLSL